MTIIETFLLVIIVLMVVHIWGWRSQFGALEAKLAKRLDEVEQWQRYHTGDQHFIVYEPNTSSYYPMYSPPHAKISTRDVVQRILNHLGMKLRYVKGEPERVDLDVQPNAALMHPQEKP